MAACLECTDSLSLDDILRLVTTCDENGNVAWKLKTVEFTGDCHSCGEFESIEDFIRKSLYCEDGEFFIQVVST
jgi:hypothetical protein